MGHPLDMDLGAFEHLHVNTTRQSPTNYRFKKCFEVASSVVSCDVYGMWVEESEFLQRESDSSSCSDGRNVILIVFLDDARGSIYMG